MPGEYVFRQEPFRSAYSNQDKREMEQIGTRMLSPHHYYRKKSEGSSGLMEISGVKLSCPFSTQEGSRYQRRPENGLTENKRAEYSSSSSEDHTVKKLILQQHIQACQAIGKSIQENGKQPAALFSSFPHRVRRVRLPSGFLVLFDFQIINPLPLPLPTARASRSYAIF